MIMVAQERPHRLTGLIPRDIALLLLAISASVDVGLRQRLCLHAVLETLFCTHRIHYQTFEDGILSVL